MKEFKIIESIIKKIPKDRDVVIPAGDDAALISDKFGSLVITQDVMAEDTHFSLKYSDGKNIATKLFNSNMSDLASMGSYAKFAMLSAGINSNFDKYLQDFINTITVLCAENNITILGGDTVKSKNCFFSFLLMGTKNKTVLKRKLASAGDIICLSGYTGVSSLGLNILESGKYPQNEAVKTHLNGINRCDLINVMQSCSIRCATDVSDGLFFNACDLPKKGLGININSSIVPISPLLKSYSREYIFDKIFFGGEDFELLFTVSADNVEKVKKKFKTQKKDFFAIGEIIDEKKFLIDSKEPQNKTFDHFN